MTPAAAAARGAERARRATRPADAPAKRPPLRVVEPGARRRRVRRRRLAPVMSVTMVVGSLLTVVVGHAVLAEGQVRLSTVQSALSAAQAENRQETLAVAALETPSRIVSEAKVRLHMQAAGQTVQLPYVPLTTPVATPTLGSSSPAAVLAATGR